MVVILIRLLDLKNLNSLLWWNNSQRNIMKMLSISHTLYKWNMLFFSWCIITFNDVTTVSLSRSFHCSWRYNTSKRNIYSAFTINKNNLINLELRSLIYCEKLVIQMNPRSELCLNPCMKRHAIIFSNCFALSSFKPEKFIFAINQYSDGEPYNNFKPLTKRVA